MVVSVCRYIPTTHIFSVKACGVRLFLLPLFTRLRGREILGSCAKLCNPSYLELRCVTRRGLRVRPMGKGEPMPPQEARDHSFDDLARGLASGSISRGKALRLMGAALVGGTLASLGIGEAAADDECKPLNKKCRKNHQCCSENCDSVSGTCTAACGAIGATCTGNTDCCSELVCKGPPGQRTCAAACIPPRTTCTPGSCPSDCPCQATPEDASRYCIRNPDFSSSCVTSCDCPTGQFCIIVGGVGNVCASPC